jgi:hypothetical protein
MGTVQEKGKGRGAHLDGRPRKAKVYRGTMGGCKRGGLSVDGLFHPC